MPREIDEIPIATIGEFFQRDFRGDFGALPPPETEWHCRLLFRGLPDSRWALETTLERFTKETWRLTAYEDRVLRCHAAFQSHTGLHLPINREKPVTLGHTEFPEGWLEFAVRLRHFGFPSPLLDWTRSRYVAAYFAFAEAAKADNVAIYAYIERAGAKSGAGGEPRIETIGPNLVTSPRHHTQQAEYTMAHDEQEFVRHQEAFSRTLEGQDLIKKYVLPAKERERTLEVLQSMNINAYSLFHDEAGLCQSLAIQHLLLKEK